MPFWPVWKSAGTPSSSIAAQSGAKAGRQGERLQAGVELEAADAVLLDKVARSIDCSALMGVDRAERDQDIGMGSRGLGDLLAGERGVPGRRGRVDGEHDRRHAGIAVAGGQVGDGRVSGSPSP